MQHSKPARARDTDRLLTAKNVTQLLAADDCIFNCAFPARNAIRNAYKDLVMVNRFPPLVQREHGLPLRRFNPEVPETPDRVQVQGHTHHYPSKAKGAR
jgi:hypothetical protein